VNVAGIDLSDPRPVGGGQICRSFTGTSGDGRRLFAKTLRDAPRGFFVAEARGLQWLARPDGPPLPEVIAYDDDGLVLTWVEPAAPTAEAAVDFGRALAALHEAGASTYGADDDGFIGPLPLPDEPAADWPTFYVQRRLRPFLAALPAAHREPVEEVCAVIGDLAGPAEPPARIHGDLWSGNVLWAADGRGWLVDAAAAHGGHRETDLAMLALFGAPYLDRILAAYTEVAPLSDGWQQRVALHQLHPLLVHATLFGGGYVEQAAATARRALAG